MQSIEDEDNPLAALVKRAAEQEMQNQNNDPVIVFNQANDTNEDENDNGPINLSVRQPSFSRLTVGNLVPKGADESITIDGIKENDNNLISNKTLKKNDQQHTSSYSNLHFTFNNDSTQKLKCNISDSSTSENHNNRHLSHDENLKSSSYAHLKIRIEPGLEKEIDQIKNISSQLSNIENASNPILVITGHDEKENEELDDENVPIGLSVRQPSFASLCNHIIPKGGLESGDIPILIEEEPPNDSQSEQLNINNEDEGDKNLEQAIELNVRQSSYANLRLNVPTKEEEMPELMKIAIQEEQPQQNIGSRQNNSSENVTNNSSPIIVLTGNDDSQNEENDEENVPIGLSVRQPSFASLCNHIIPKGGLESGEMPILIEEEPPPKSQPEELHEYKRKEDDDNLEQAIGLQVRQSSYANLKLNVPPKEGEMPDLMKLAIKEEQSQQSLNSNISSNKSNVNVTNNSNPIIVLTGNDDSQNEENDEENVPIGLSIRQPSFASLCNHIIPKGGHESGEMPILIEEQPPENNKEDVNEKEAANAETNDENTPMILNVRQSSYANLHFSGQSGNIPAIEPIPDEEEPNLQNVNNDTYGEDALIVLTKDDEKDDDAPIGLSVRQPSFASLHGNVVPKGGFQSLVPTITEEAPATGKGEELVEDKEISDIDVDGSSDNSDNEIQKANENNNVDSEKLEMKDKILNSLLTANKDWWEEIGYKPPDNLSNAFKRNCSMFQMPPSKDFMKRTFGSSSSNNSFSSNLKPKKRPSHSLYQGVLNNIDDLLKDDKKEAPSKEQKKGLKNRGPSLYRVNSYGNKTEPIEVQMPLLQEVDDEDDNAEKHSIEPTKITYGNGNNNDEEAPQNIIRGPSLLRVNSFGNASKLKVVEMPDVPENDLPSQKSNDQIAIENNQSNPDCNRSSESNKDQNKKIVRGPSMKRVSSFGNASKLKIVDMPSIDEGNNNEQSADAYEEDEEEEEEDNSGIPPNILKMMKKPYDPIVYSALCGASISGYERETISKALSDLQSLNIKCQNKGLTDESEFITQVINTVRSDAAQNNAFFEVEEQMRETEVNLQEKLTDWQNIYEELDEEYQNQLDECEEKYQQELLSLEQRYHNQQNTEVNSTQCQSESQSQYQSDDNLSNENDSDIKYDDNQSKPHSRKRYSTLTPHSASILSPSVSSNAKQSQRRSKAVYSSSSSKYSSSPYAKSLTPKDAKMKEKVQKMIKAQRFEESFELSLKFYKKQMVEHQKQITKRSQAYLAAKTALRQKHEDEKNEIVLNFQSRRAEFTKKREQSLVPLREQLIQLRKVKVLIEESEKNEKFNETMQPRLRASRAKKGRPTNLTLPPLSSASMKSGQ